MPDSPISAEVEIKPVDAQPQPVHLEDYQPPAFRVSHTELKFDLAPSATRVSAILHMERHPDSAPGRPLELDGERLSLKRIAIDGQELQAGEYRVDEARLIIAEPPERLRPVTGHPHRPRWLLLPGG